VLVYYYYYLVFFVFCICWPKFIQTTRLYFPNPFQPTCHVSSEIFSALTFVITLLIILDLICYPICSLFLLIYEYSFEKQINLNKQKHQQKLITIKTKNICLNLNKIVIIQISQLMACQGDPNQPLRYKNLISKS